MSDHMREATRRFREGEIGIVTDDDDRENEGDLVCAASLCTPEKMAFIIRHTCGIVCTPLTEARARALNLAPMVANNDAPLGTAFIVTVDVVHGLTTGTSAEQRSNTVRALANDDGTVMKGPQIDAFATEHGLVRISVADLIAWRQEREHLVERVGEFTAASPIGEMRVIAYATRVPRSQERRSRASPIPRARSSSTASAMPWRRATLTRQSTTPCGW